MEKQVLNSPFIKKEYLNLVKQFNNEQDKIFDDFAISDKTIVNIGNRDFVDYRPTIKLSDSTLKDNDISVGINSYGQSAPYKDLFENFNLTSNKIVSQIQRKIRK